MNRRTTLHAIPKSKCKKIQESGRIKLGIFPYTTMSRKTKNYSPYKGKIYKFPTIFVISDMGGDYKDLDFHHRYISNKIISAQGYCHSWYNVQTNNLTVL